MRTRQHTPGDAQARPTEAISPVRLAAVAAALHVAILAHRMAPGALTPGTRTMLVWRPDGISSGDRRGVPGRVPSRPIHSFSAGELDLSRGMAVLALAVWLRVMTIHGARGL